MSGLAVHRAARVAWLWTLAAIAACSAARAQDAGLAPLPPPIEASIVVDAPLDEVWEAWTTSAGVPTFLGFEAQVEARPRGTFRVTFERAKSEPLDRGNDGMVLAIQPRRMITISWMTPMHMASLRGQSTLLAIYLDPLGERRTQVRIVNTGYGTGPEWSAAYDYNVRGWRNVLKALEYRFRNGPIDWDVAMKHRKERGRWPWFD
ncbi:MAG: SRPBCC domain-containing protein [Steroidobacteraceae bacterium]|jgi:uncharacterized protein YndB with AHSA1/START domain|nr:SRPBCC domain-containing protein [Steroidobacteraceae bacterium]